MKVKDLVQYIDSFKRQGIDVDELDVVMPREGTKYGLTEADQAFVNEVTYESCNCNCIITRTAFELFTELH